MNMLMTINMMKKNIIHHNMNHLLPLLNKNFKLHIFCYLTSTNHTGLKINCFVEKRKKHSLINALIFIVAPKEENLDYQINQVFFLIYLTKKAISKGIIII